MGGIILDIVLLFFLVVCALAAVRMRDLLSATVVLGAYSLIMAVIWTVLNAVDVAFTEASVGAGITSVLLLATLSRTRRGEAGFEDAPRRRVVTGFRPGNLVLLLVAVFTFATLVYGSTDLPDFGDPEAPIHTHVAPRYIESAYKETGVINLVTAVLASYRGYDTLGEATVIFTAGLAVIVLLRRTRE